MGRVDMNEFASPAEQELRSQGNEYAEYLNSRLAPGQKEEFLNREVITQAEYDALEEMSGEQLIRMDVKKQDLAASAMKKIRAEIEQSA